MFFHISTHSTATHGVPLPSSALKLSSFRCTSPVAEGFHIRLRKPPALSLRPINPDNACHLRITADCWHVVSRDFLVKYRQRMNSYSHTCSSLTTELYEPKPFFTHAVLLHQACAHCGRFPTAASRRSMGRVSSPICGRSVTLSTRLCIIALVGRYPTNKLMHRRSIQK